MTVENNGCRHGSPDYLLNQISTKASHVNNISTFHIGINRDVDYPASPITYNPTNHGLLTSNLANGGKSAGCGGNHRFDSRLSPPSVSRKGRAEDLAGGRLRSIRLFLHISQFFGAKQPLPL